MQCPNCGHEVGTDAKFCTNCGTSLQPGDVSGSDSGSQAQAHSSAAFAQKTERSKVFAKSYWSFLVRTVKQPIEASLKETNRYYGYMSIGLATLLLSFGVALMIRHSVNNVGLGGYVDSPDFFSLFIGPFIAFFGSVLLNAIVTFAIIRLVHKATIDFNVFITQYSGQATPAVFAAALFFLMELVSLNNFLSWLIFFLTILLLYFPAVASIFSYKNNSSFDRLYAYLISAAAIGIVQSIYFAIVAMSLLSQLIDQLPAGPGPFGY